MPTPPGALADAYDRRLLALTARSALRVAAAFAAYRRGGTFGALVGDLFVSWTATQLDAVTVADMMTAATVLAHRGPLLTRSPVRSQLVGVGSTGTPILDILNATPTVLENRRRNGISAAAAFDQSARWLEGTITGDVDRVARDAVIDAAQGPEATVLGWQRIAEPDACSFCRMLATRGPVYASEATAAATIKGKRYHQRCRCRVEPVTDAFTRERSFRAGQAEWARMLAAGDVPRIAGRNGRPGRAGTIGPAPSEVNLARSWQLQLDQLRGSIPGLQARVAAGDPGAERALQWQTERAAELQQKLAALRTAAA